MVKLLTITQCTHYNIIEDKTISSYDSLIMSEIAWAVDLFFRNPHWVGTSTLFLFRNLVILLWINFLRIFEKHVNIDI